LTYLMRAYPSLQSAKLVYQTRAAVVWNRPSGVRQQGAVVVDAKHLFVEKDLDATSRTNALWDAVKYKQV